jgi:hypothetical protein
MASGIPAAILSEACAEARFYGKLLAFLENAGPASENPLRHYP